MSVAITYVCYGVWDGYGSYRAINKSFLQNGLSVQETDLYRLNLKHYFDVMTNPSMHDKLLSKASTIENPETEGMYYMQDEKGMAIFYILAFKIFGVHAGSLFYLFLSIFLCSTLILCFTFRKYSEVSYLLLLTTCALCATVFILPELPKQDINLIQSNRFIGVLSLPAIFHIILLMLYKINKTKVNVVLTIFQTVLLFLVINARTSVVWQLLAIISTVTMLWLFYYLSLKFNQKKSKKMELSRPIIWPMLMVVWGLVMFLGHQKFGYNSYFSSPNAQQGHVFWHNLVTALHNNPNRTSSFGIPEKFPIYDDQVGYYLFEKEIAKRGENYSNYLVGGPDWIFRTTSPSLDFKWDRYDKVLRSIFFKTIYENTSYALSSFLVHQPMALIKIINDMISIYWHFLRASGLVFILLIGATVIFPIKFRAALNLVKLLGITFMFSCLPIFAAAVVELRVIEVFFMLILIGMLTLGFCLNLITTLVKKWKLNYAPQQNSSLG